MDANSRAFRFLLLATSCFMTLGSYFCIDLATVLQSQVQGNIHCNGSTADDNSTCCPTCLGLTPDQFNIMFATRAWTACAFVAVSGFLIDRMGNKLAALIFSLGIVIGNALFAVSSMPPIKHTQYMFPVMLVGRIILGLSDFPTRIIQDRITAYWFKGKELSTAFGITITASRIGSVANFLVSPTIASKFGLSAAIWFGTILCGVGFLAAIAVALLDTWGVKQLGQSTAVKQSQRSRSIRDVKQLCAEFWLILLTLAFFYASIMPFIANAVKFLQDMYGLAKSTSSYITGSVYDVSIILSPILGMLVDRFGGRPVLTILVGISLIPCYVMLGLTIVYPLVLTLVMGIVYTIAAVAIWSSVALFVSNELMGVALGFLVASIGFLIELTNIIIGAILGETNNLSEEETRRRWRLYLIPVTVNALLSTAAAITAVTLDRKRNKTLSHGGRKKKPDTDDVSTNGLITSDDPPHRALPAVGSDEFRTNDTQYLIDDSASIS